MKVGRNDPCPCGSGKKYKKCCLARDQEKAARQMDVPLPPSSDAPSRRLPFAAREPKPTEPPAPTPPPRPRTPLEERADALWKEFESRQEDRGAVFLQALEEGEVIADGLAFEMLTRLHADAVARGERSRFAGWVDALRERRPEVFEEGANHYLSLCLEDALAEGRLEDVPALARELAALAGRNLDTVNRDLEALAYHGQLSVLIEALRIGWPSVKAAGPDKIFAWAVSEFANKGADHEIFDYLEHTPSPDPADPALLERIKFFIEDPRTDYLAELIGDLTGKSGREWTADDFVLSPPRKKRRDDWEDEEEEEPAPDRGAVNLSRLIAEFVGYLRREEGVPYPRGELLRHELFRYFVRRHEGDLDPRPSMLESALHPNLKLPKPPRPAHPLCPERITLDVHLAGLVNFFNSLHHRAAVLFQAMPAWLRFLESRRLNAATRAKVAQELLPLYDSVVRLWENFTDDPTLYRDLQGWPANAAR